MIVFSIKRYKSSVSLLRQALGVGVPANRDGDVVDVQNGTTTFRFNVKDLYLTHMKLDTDPDWREIKRHNYSQMGIQDDFLISGGKIRSATGVPIPSGTHLALVIVATAEAARSQVVYKIVQQMLQTPALKLTWGQLKPLLIGSWILNTQENHKRRPISYGALRSRDYYNAEAVNAINAIRATGFHLD